MDLEPSSSLNKNENSSNSSIPPPIKVEVKQENVNTNKNLTENTNCSSQSESNLESSSILSKTIVPGSSSGVTASNSNSISNASTTKHNSSSSVSSSSNKNEPISETTTAKGYKEIVYPTYTVVTKPGTGLASPLPGFYGNGQYGGPYGGGGTHRNRINNPTNSRSANQPNYNKGGTRNGQNNNSNSKSAINNTSINSVKSSVSGKSIPGSSSSTTSTTNVTKTSLHTTIKNDNQAQSKALNQDKNKNDNMQLVSSSTKSPRSSLDGNAMQIEGPNGQNAVSSNNNSNFLSQSPMNEMMEEGQTLLSNPSSLIPTLGMNGYPISTNPQLLLNPNEMRVTSEGNDINLDHMSPEAQMYLHQMHQLLGVFWIEQGEEMRDLFLQNEQDFKNYIDLPLARIKRIMKSDEDVHMISAEVLVLFAKACEMFILEMTIRSWCYSEKSKRRTLQREDIQTAINQTETFDFLIDLLD